MHKIIATLLTGLALTGVAKADTTQVNCLATAIYHEARGEPTQCQHMVADVVLNRASSKFYPKTVCNVVYQRGQFSWVGKGYSIREQQRYSQAKKIATLKYSGYVSGNHRDGTGNSLYFTTGKRFGPVKARCGNHVFMGRKQS